jgi:hypothetical protein
MDGLKRVAAIYESEGCTFQHAFPGTGIQITDSALLG